MKFEAVGMRTSVVGRTINTCAGNDTASLGDGARWIWANPTNRAIVHRYAGIEAVSVEALWQGTKMREGQERPDEATLRGDWRRGKGRRPAGAWAGEDCPLITSPGAARRAIYIPAFARLIAHWLPRGARDLVEEARAWVGTIYLRDFDTGRGIDQRGPMSHAWLLSVWLNSAQAGSDHEDDIAGAMLEAR